MSETERYSGKIKLIPRLENETDGEYFERVTGVEWSVYDTYEPESINEAINENCISYFDMKRGKKGYCCIDDNIYEFIELKDRDISENYCTMEKVDVGTYKFDAMYYNGGTCLDEILQSAFDNGVV